MNNSNNQPRESADRCVICQQFFHRARKSQKTCGGPDCRKKRKREQEKAWIRSYREKTGQSYYEGGYDRLREWRRDHPDYQRQWRTRRQRGEIHNAKLPEDIIQPVLLRLRIPQALRLSEIQTLSLRLTRSGSDFVVDGAP